VGGSVLVLLSVIGMAGSHWIEETLSCTKQDPESGSSKNLEQEKVTSIRMGSKIVHVEDLEDNCVSLLTDKK